LTGSRREQLLSITAITALWAVFLVQAWQSPTLLDDWFQLGWCKGRVLGLDLIAQVVRYSYLHSNPRIGDLFLLLVDGSRVIHLVLTPLVEMVLLWAVFVVTFGRRPGLGYRDLERALFLQAMIWLAAPIPALVYFFRPYTTNYLFAFAAMLGFFAPYRLALAGPPGSHRRWAAAPMFVLGWLAGMGNEHTGPAAVLAVGVCLIHAGRRRRLRAWMVAGALGLVLGVAMLLFAPGQAERYAGEANQIGLLGRIASRGVAGNYEVIAGFVGEAGWAIAFVVAAVLVFVRHHQRAGVRPPAMPRDRLLASVGFIAAAGAILVTLFASPATTDRVLFAPAVLLVGALAVVADHLFAVRQVRALITVACAIVFAYHAVRFVQVYASGGAENRHRIAILRAARPGTVARIPAYRPRRGRSYPADDFRIAAIREYVAHEVFDLAGIELDDRPVWAEPTPPEHFVAHRIYEPPLPPELDAAHPLPRYVASSVSAALVQLNRGLALGSWRSIDGHRLVRYAIDAVGLPFTDPRHRPVHVLEWTPEAVRFLDGESIEDRNGQPGLRVVARALPEGWTDAFLVSCGRTTRVEPRRDDERAADAILPVFLACREAVTAVVCAPDACWFAGRYRYR
jgi:hypothetical protein